MKSKKKLYILTFIITFAIINLIYMIKGVTPFGNNSLLTVDFYHQYGPMLGEYYDRIFNLSSLTYSFNIGLGIPIFRNFANYLASPINIIILLFKRTNLLTSYSFLISIKASLASTFTVMYLNNKFKKENLLFIPLGILYAFSAYFIAYYWNIMWIDGMYFIPLITLGIEYLINEDKYKLYTISLGLMLITNYFIGYMLCIYSVLYFIMYYLVKNGIKNIKKNYKTILKFTYASLLSGALAAIILIPLYYSLGSISATGSSMPTTQYYSFGIIDFLKGHFTGITTTTFASDTITNPNVSCGIFIIFLSLLFIINKNIKTKTKIGYLSLLLCFILIFFIPQLDFIMQAFHVPNDLPYRYSFIYSFILIIMSSYVINYIKETKFRDYILIFTILMGTLIYMLIKNNWADLTPNMIYINMILLTLYIIFIAYYYFLKNNKWLYITAIIIIAALESVIAIGKNWNIDQNKFEFTNNYQNYQAIRDKLAIDNKFYRMEVLNNLTLNDGAWFNYHGNSTFSSMAYENMAILEHKLGIPGNEINSYYYVEQTPIYDMMFGIKYTYGEHLDQTRYKLKEINNDVIINEFKYDLGLAYGVDNSIKTINYMDDDPFIIQNEFIKKAANIEEDILYEMYPTKKEIIEENDDYTIVKYNYENPNDNLYFYANDYIIDFIIIGDTLYKNREYDYISETVEDLYTTIDDYEEEKIISILSEDKNISIYISYNSYIRDGFLLYSINNDKFINAYNILKNNQLEINLFKENKIEGTINIDYDKTLYTSIPYDDGWAVYVDGKKVKTKALANSLLTIDIEKGNHTITFKYHIPKFIIGSIISIISVLLLIFDTKILNKIKKNT